MNWSDALPMAVPATGQVDDWVVEADVNVVERTRM
jgi:hypothetical protein